MSSWVPMRPVNSRNGRSVVMMRFSETPVCVCINLAMANAVKTTVVDDE